MPLGLYLPSCSPCRLAFHAFYLDVTLYFLCGHRPTLRYEDLNLTSPCSEQLWEAMTLDSWKQTMAIELGKRTTMKFVDYIDQAMDPERRPGLPYLVEDEYLYGLCAMQAWIHRDANNGRCWMPSGLPVPTRGASHPTGSAWSATYWATQLDSWRAKYEIDKPSGMILSSRLHAEVIDMNAMSLYHLSQLELRVDLKDITELSAGESSGSNVSRRKIESRMVEWAVTSDARWALWHAAQVLKLWRERVGHGNGHSGITMDHGQPRIGLPALTALYEAGLTIWAYTRSIQACGSCVMGSSLPATRSTAQPFDVFQGRKDHSFHSWVKHGGGELFDGSIVCACRAGQLIEYFQSSLAYGSRHWQCGFQMAAKLSRLRDAR